LCRHRSRADRRTRRRLQADQRLHRIREVIAAVFVFTEINPLIVVLAAGVIGYFGVV
jgi:chromate transporter